MKKLIFLSLCALCFIACSKNANITVKNLSQYDITVSVGNTTYDAGISAMSPNTTGSFETNCETSPHTVGVYVAYYDLPNVFNGDISQFFKYYKTNPTNPSNGYDYLVIVTNDTVNVSLK